MPSTRRRDRHQGMYNKPLRPLGYIATCSPYGYYYAFSGPFRRRRRSGSRRTTSNRSNFLLPLEPLCWNSSIAEKWEF